MSLSKRSKKLEKRSCFNATPFLFVYIKKHIIYVLYRKFFGRLRLLKVSELADIISAGSFFLHKGGKQKC